jgi:hypothetical protein
VALAGDDDDITRSGRPEGGVDGLGPVGHDQHAFTVEGAGDNIVDDGARVLAPGVVGGDDHEVRQARRHLPHQGTLLLVPVTAGTEHDEEAPVGQLARRAEGLHQTVGGVGVVHEDGEVLAGVDGLEAAPNPLQ